jgi:ribonuclease BN (tRNA processing enzyme)
MAKIVFLGTNGFYDSETGNTISILIETNECYIVLDAGYGIWKLGQYVQDDRPVYLFISHFHLDHIVGLHTLALNKFSRGLNIITQRGGTLLLNTIVNSPFTIPFKDLPFSTKIVEVPGSEKELPFKAEFLPMVHAAPTMGMRMEIDGRVIAYCPDTGFCENAVTLAREADLLIAECAFRPNETNEAWPHLNPETAARIARDAGAKKLALVHFDALRYGNIEARIEAEQKARETFEASYMSVDGAEIEI